MWSGELISDMQLAEFATRHEVATAHEFADKQVAGAQFTEPSIRGALGCVEGGVFTLLNNVVTDAEKPATRRHLAAMAQYLYSGHKDAAMIKFVTDNTLLRSLLREGLAKENRFNWHSCYDIIQGDVMSELASLLD